MLGYVSGVQIDATLSTPRVSHNSAPVAIRRVTCIGNETNIADCDVNFQSSEACFYEDATDYNQQAASVLCSNPSGEPSIAVLVHAGPATAVVHLSVSDVCRQSHPPRQLLNI